MELPVIGWEQSYSPESKSFKNRLNKIQQQQRMGIFMDT